MSTSKPQGTPVNLKERIAALEQRNVSPPPALTTPVNLSAAHTTTALRDRIAKFERKGGIPVPRGSFGLGAPPLVENSPQKKRGELYGNRIPGTLRGASTNLAPIRSSTLLSETSRSLSVSAIHDDSFNREVRNIAPPASAPISPCSSRGLSDENYGSDDGTHCTSPSSTTPDVDKHSKSRDETSAGFKLDTSSLAAPQGSANEQVIQPSFQFIVSSEDAAVYCIPKVDKILLKEAVIDEAPVDSQLSISEPLESDIGPLLPLTSDHNHSISPSTSNSDSLGQHHANMYNRDVSQKEAVEETAQSSLQSPSSQSPFAVPADLTIDILPPIPSPSHPLALTNLAHRPRRSKSPPQDLNLAVVSSATIDGADDATAEISREFHPSLTSLCTENGIMPAICVDDESEKLERLEDTARGLKAIHRDLPSLVTVSSNVLSRTTSNTVSSPPLITVSKLDQKDDRDVRNDSGVRQPHKRSDSSQIQPTFSAVVYKKVAEVPAALSSGTTAAFYSTPITPRAVQDESSKIEEPILSPSFGELTTLLTNASLLEKSLETGEFLKETIGKNGKTQSGGSNQNGRSETEIVNTDKLSTAKNKSKGHSAILRSKTWKKDDSGEVQVNPVRSQSFLTFRSGQDSFQNMQGLHREFKGGDSETASQKSSATLSRSPRQYLASLRRLAGGSNSSTPTLSRYSVSTSSEMSSEDSAWIPNTNTTVSGDVNKGWNVPGSPKKGTSTLNRAATFADRMFGRSRTKSTMNGNESIARSTSVLLPPLESLSYEIDIPDLSASSDDFLSHERLTADYTTLNHQSSASFGTRRSSTVGGVSALAVMAQDNCSALPSGRLCSEPISAATLGRGREQVSGAMPSPDGSAPQLLIPGSIVSPASTLHSPPLPDSPATKSLLSTPEARHNTRDSWISGDSSTDTSILIPGLLVDSFPSVPREIPSLSACGP